MSTDLKTELFLRWEIWRRCLSMHHDTSIEGRETFFSSKQKSTFMIYGGFLYYYIILLCYYLYSEMNKGKSEALQNKQKKVQIYHQIYHLSPPPRNSRYFSVQFSLGKF